MVKSQNGFTFIALLFVLLLFGLGSVTFARYWSEIQRRDRETEWLRVGSLYAAAIADYYLASPGSVKQYPRRLEELTEDNRFVGLRRHLRRVYGDPLLSGAGWEVLREPQGGIFGVRSISNHPPLRQVNFGPWVQLRGAPQKYADIEFVFVPEREERK